MREETIKSCTTYVQDDCVRRENVIKKSNKTPLQKEFDILFGYVLFYALPCQTKTEPCLHTSCGLLREKVYRTLQARGWRCSQKRDYV